MSPIPANDIDASRPTQKNDKLDEQSNRNLSAHLSPLELSSMKAPSVKECILAFLFMCCFATIYNYGLSFLEETTTSSYSSLIPSWRTSNGHHWVDTFTASPQAVRLDQVTWPPFSGTPVAFHNTTLRQTIQVTLGGEQIRIRLSNRYGATDLDIGKVTVAFPQTYYGNRVGSRNIDIHSLQPVTFSGSEWAIIPDGALVVSDPITFDRPIVAGQVLSVTMYLREGQDSEYITAHVGSRTTTWMEFGDYTRAEEMPLGIGRHGPHWYFLSAVEVWSSVDCNAFAVLGDSITNGRGGRMNSNAKWPHLLFNRMQEASPGISRISVVNQGAGGNQLLQDGQGPNAAARLDRDVLAQSGIGYVMIFEGINDIGHALANPTEQSRVESRLVQSYKQMILRIHAFGIPVFGGTLTPFMCHNSGLMNRYARDSIREQTRLNVNHWIRYSGWFDAVIDFDVVLRDPSNSTQMSPEYDSGDCLHPNDDGFEAMAKHFPMDVFEKFDRGVNNFT